MPAISTLAQFDAVPINCCSDPCSTLRCIMAVTYKIPSATFLPYLMGVATKWDKLLCEDAHRALHTVATDTIVSVSSCSSTAHCFLYWTTLSSWHYFSGGGGVFMGQRDPHQTPVRVRSTAPGAAANKDGFTHSSALHQEFMRSDQHFSNTEHVNHTCHAVHFPSKVLSVST